MFSYPPRCLFHHFYYCCFSVSVFPPSYCPFVSYLITATAPQSNTQTFTPTRQITTAQSAQSAFYSTDPSWTGGIFGRFLLFFSFPSTFAFPREEHRVSHGSIFSGHHSSPFYIKQGRDGRSRQHRNHRLPRSRKASAHGCQARNRRNGCMDGRKGNGKWFSVFSGVTCIPVAVGGSRHWKRSPSFFSMTTRR